jgi:N-methylhydantoinase B
MSNVTAGAARIRTDVIWQRLIAITENQAQTLIRTAFSTATREAGDLSAGIFDARGRMVAQAITGTPGHVNAMALAVEHFLRRFPLATLAPGDVLVSNDPWLCSGHLHDFTVVTPIFHRGRSIGVAANTVHVVDIGGLGYGPDGSEVFEEGICVPICKLASAGRLDPLLLDLLRANVREPEQVVGDLYSCVAGNDLAAASTSGLMTEFDLDDLQDVADAIIDRTRATVEGRISALPDGVYPNQLSMDGYGDELKLRVAITIDGARMRLDFAGSSPVSRRGINVVLNYTTAYAVFGVNCVLNPDIPCNHGSLSPIEVQAPAGSILNALRPAAVSARHMVGHMLPDLVLGALAPVLEVPAEGAGLIWNPSFRGRTRQGLAFATASFNAGGAGAQADRDGWNTTAFPSGVRSMPVEAVETIAPLLFRRKELRPDSGGGGRFRGGLGQIIEITSDGAAPLFVNAMFDRLEHPARGRAGGLPGAVGSVRLASGTPMRGKGLQEIPPGDALILELPGGGGYGPPADRAAQAIADDITNGYTSIAVVAEA